MFIFFTVMTSTDPTVVLDTDGTRNHAKFCCRTSHHFREDIMTYRGGPEMWLSLELNGPMGVKQFKQRRKPANRQGLWQNPTNTRASSS